MASLPEFSLCKPSVLPPWPCQGYPTLTCTSAASAPAQSGGGGDARKVYYPCVVSGGSLAQRGTVESAVTLKSPDSGDGGSERCYIQQPVSDVAHKQQPAVQTSPVASGLNNCPMKSADQRGKKNPFYSPQQEYPVEFDTTVEPVSDTFRRFDRGRG